MPETLRQQNNARRLRRVLAKYRLWTQHPRTHEWQEFTWLPLMWHFNKRIGMRSVRVKRQGRKRHG